MKKEGFTAILFVGLYILSGRGQAAPVPLTSGMKITQKAVIAPATYSLTDAGNGIAQISGKDFTVDFQGAKLRGPGQDFKGFAGIGLHITDAQNVTIKNADVSGCLWGVMVERSSGVKLINCVTSRNADLPPGTVIDESGREPEDQHGGGILLRDSRNCLAQKCVSQHQWDGIDVVRSQDCVIEDGDFSYNGNWGLHLWDSSRNTFRRNRAVWCTTGEGALYQALTGWQTYDSQAVGIDHNSNENLIESNDLRFGGDAIFIRANEGPITPGTVVPPRNGSHRNILRNNDCSFSPNNAIEVDLVDDTIIEGNNCSFSNYGMWLGYSRRCMVRNNLCINDSSHAVEIENGQDDVFENNVFGYDMLRPNGQLVYLRQNGRDATRSGGYVFKKNVFYGAKTGVLLRATGAAFIDNALSVPSGIESVPFAAQQKEDSRSPVEERGTTRLLFPTGVPEKIIAPPTLRTPLRPGSLVTVAAPGLLTEAGTPFVEVDGIPAWTRKVEPNALTFWMPLDFWDRPAAGNVQIRVAKGAVLTQPLTAAVIWPDKQPRINSLSPNPAKIGDVVTLEGFNLNSPGTRVLFNNQPVSVVEATPNKITVRLPEGILTPTHYNVLAQRGAGENTVSTWPITLGVEVPRERMPHLTNAAFSPTTLHVGELLKVTFTVRNNLPTFALLMTGPKTPFTYEEKQAAGDVGMAELPGYLHLRVTSDHPGNHEPGSWPYLFGFNQPRLAPGETTTVTGYIRVETPGVHEFRVGLVAGGFRFIDDNAYRTKIIVLPRE